MLRWRALGDLRGWKLHRKNPSKTDTVASGGAAAESVALAGVGAAAIGNAVGNIISNNKGKNSGGSKGEASSDPMVGENGTQTSSKTTWKNGKTERIDVENPFPGERPGQVHYYDSSNNKWYYDIKENVFYDQKQVI